MKYKYVAHDSDHRLVQGTLAVETEEQANEMLRQAGYETVSLKRAGSEWLKGLLASFEHPVSTKSLISFTRSLTRYLESGLKVSHALELLQSNLSDKSMRKIVADLSQQLLEGTSLADSMSCYPKAFSQIYVRLVQIGEETGNLPTVLKQLTTQIQKQSELIKKAKRAMTYPAIVITLSFAVGALFLFVIMPKMAMLLEALDTELPWTTMVIITAADLAAEYGALAFLVLATLGLLSVWLTRLRRGREARDWALLKLPLLGKINLYGEVARLTRNMSLLMGSGLRLSEALALLEPVSGNTIIRNEIQGIRFRLLEGQRISHAFSQSQVFPRDVGDIMMVGEETGKLPEALGSIAETYEAEADESLTALMGLIEPTMTLGMGLAIGFLALSIVTPMYSVAGSLQ